MTDQVRDYKRLLLRAQFQSLIWNAFSARKKIFSWKMKDLAERAGVHKSYLSRCFNTPQNWQIDRIADFADALDLELVIEARDRKTGMIVHPGGYRHAFSSSSTCPVTSNGVLSTTRSDSDVVTVRAVAR